jgi:hypothetical protein
VTVTQWPVALLHEVNEVKNIKREVYLTVELRVVEPYRTCGTRGTVQLGSISDSDIGIGSAGIEGPR